MLSKNNVIILFICLLIGVNTASARYIESDPIGLEGGLNTYGYAYQNPVKYIDPDGRWAFLVAIPAAIGIKGSTAVTVTGLLTGGLIVGQLGGSTMNSDALPQDKTQDKDKTKEQCEDENCPPCKTISGRIVPPGTVGYRPLDVIPDDEMQHGVYGSHHNIFIAKQAPRGTPQPCKCFWRKQKYVLKPYQLTPDMVPVEPFI